MHLFSTIVEEVQIDIKLVQRLCRQFKTLPIKTHTRVVFWKQNSKHCWIVFNIGSKHYCRVDNDSALAL